ncbi:hypothetical protein SDC9_86810 [bioreactor metagenome]|uniref:Uncharacterized protein n=1 Tax=bioreactor metagenome TaxID=1076179 RepID=A0A644ZH34_9ZZZZ
MHRHHQQCGTAPVVFGVADKPVEDNGRLRAAFCYCPNRVNDYFFRAETVLLTHRNLFSQSVFVAEKLLCLLFAKNDRLRIVESVP